MHSLEAGNFPAALSPAALSPVAARRQVHCRREEVVLRHQLAVMVARRRKNDSSRSLVPHRGLPSELEAGRQTRSSLAV